MFTFVFILKIPWFFSFSQFETKLEAARKTYFQLHQNILSLTGFRILFFSLQKFSSLNFFLYLASFFHSSFSESKIFSSSSFTFVHDFWKLAALLQRGTGYMWVKIVIKSAGNLHAGMSFYAPRGPSSYICSSTSQEINIFSSNTEAEDPVNFKDKWIVTWIKSQRISEHIGIRKDDRYI